MQSEADISTIVKAVAVPIVSNSVRVPLLKAFPELDKVLPGWLKGHIEAVESRLNCVVADGEIHNLYSMISHGLTAEKRQLPESVTYTTFRNHYKLE